MGGRGSSTPKVTFQMARMTPPPTLTNQQAIQQNNSVFKATDNADYHQLYNGRQYFLNQALTGPQMQAIMSYIDPRTEPGSLYSESQNLNTAMATGAQLTPQQQYMQYMLMDSMHNLGYNLTLTRYDHTELVNSFLKQNGINANVNTATAQDFQKLVGHEYRENRFVSTSYNNFGQSSSNPFQDRQVKINIRAKANTQGVMPGDATGINGKRNSLGEIILSPTTRYKITNVSIIGNKGRIKQTQSRTARQIEITVEAWQD